MRTYLVLLVTATHLAAHLQQAHAVEPPQAPPPKPSATTTTATTTTTTSTTTNDNLQPTSAISSTTALLDKYVGPPLRLFRGAPPITRSWVSASVVLSLLSAHRIVDVRAIAFDERTALRRGELWRLVANFFYMGDQYMSVFYWMQIYHFWECLRMLELVKYHWEPSAFVKMIVCTSGLLLLLKQQMAPALMFLGSPLVMVFMYMYAREYGVQMTNFMGFFQIQCGWLPFAQMLQDLAQTGDIMPNLIGLLAGHTYYYAAEVAPRLVMPDELPSLGSFLEGVALSHKRKRRADADASESADASDGGDAERRVEEAQGEVSGGEDSALDAPDDAAVAAADNEGVASVRAGGSEVPEREHVGVSAVEAAADVDDESLADLSSKP